MLPCERRHFQHVAALAERPFVMSRVLSAALLWLACWTLCATASAEDSPVVVAQPTNLSAPVGVDIALRVEATGSNPLSYQWLFEGTNIAGATGNTLILTNINPSATGLYAVLVTNSLGLTRSSNAVVTVRLNAAALHHLGFERCAARHGNSWIDSHRLLVRMGYQLRLWSKHGTNRPFDWHCGSTS